MAGGGSGVKLPAVADPASTLVVNEIFGPTFQGEGPSAGQRAVFVRLAGCCLSCRWCDTAWTWDATRFDLAAEQHPLHVDSVLDRLGRQDCDLVVITGGEPLLQQDAVAKLADGICAKGIASRVEVETAGTVPPRPAVLTAVTGFNVSPKLAHSGMPRHRRIRPAVLRQFAASGKAVFKFVACGTGDLEEISEITRSCDLAPVWVMPEGRDTATILTRMRVLAGPVVSRGWNLSARLQVLLWEDERGR
jgi:7-cyano-7-deazaguanosine (preQ0) biosynthesis protein QueE